MPGSKEFVLLAILDIALAAGGDVPHAELDTVGDPRTQDPGDCSECIVCHYVLYELVYLRMKPLGQLRQVLGVLV